MNIKLFIIGFLYFILGQSLAWLQVYGPILWPVMKKNIVIAVIILAPLISIVYIRGTRYIVDAFGGEVWPSRLIGFSAAIIVFSIMTGIFFKEGLNVKTIISIILCVIILLIQIIWRN